MFIEIQRFCGSCPKTFDTDCMYNITFVNKANFLKVCNNFVLKWSIFALYVVLVSHRYS
jgi:hypothetical protein